MFLIQYHHMSKMCNTVLQTPETLFTYTLYHALLHFTLMNMKNLEMSDPLCLKLAKIDHILPEVAMTKGR